MKKTFHLDGIPDEMKQMRAWLYWIRDKLPKTLRNDPMTGKCNHTNPDCLASLEEVLARIEHFTCPHGLAFGFLREFGLTYVDLDDCRNPQTGELTEFATDVVRRLNSYTEISIGGKGLHLVVRAQVEKSRMHTKRKWAGKQIEIKSQGFYMTVSGNRFRRDPQRNRRPTNSAYGSLRGDI